MFALPALLLVTWFLALTGDTAMPASTTVAYQNERFGYVVVAPRGYERLPSAATGDRRVFDLRLLDREHTMLAAFYGVRGPVANDSAVVAEMHQYLAGMEKEKRVLLLEGPLRLDAAGRQGAVWSLLHLEDGMLWRMALLPHDPGGRSAIYLTVIVVTDPEVGERLDEGMSRLLRGVRFVQARKQ